MLKSSVDDHVLQELMFKDKTPQGMEHVCQLFKKLLTYEGRICGSWMMKICWINSDIDYIPLAYVPKHLGHLSSSYTWNWTFMVVISRAPNMSARDKQSNENSMETRSENHLHLETYLNVTTFQKFVRFSSHLSLLEHSVLERLLTGLS